MVLNTRLHSALQHAPHPTLDGVVVVPLAGGFGPKPLATPTVSSLKPSSTPEEQSTFQAVLDSIPVPQLHEQVAAALEDGAEVGLPCVSSGVPGMPGGEGGLLVGRYRGSSSGRRLLLSWPCCSHLLSR